MAAAFSAVKLCLLSAAMAQQIGMIKKEVHPPIALTTCAVAGGCKSQDTTLTMDAQWRWLHDARKGQTSNCFDGAAWDKKLCKDTKSTATGCALEGMTLPAYQSTYGVTQVPGGVSLKFVNGKNGSQSVGSRLYMMEDENTYKMFKLLNREFTFDVDVSTLDCGLNGALYFVEMKADGGKGIGGNKAGAKYGTGYCDAQCPHDLKFISGEANLENWHKVKSGMVGKYGSCCSEMDIWEANSIATAYTAHPCETSGPQRCSSNSTPDCGDTEDNCKCCGRHHLEENCECCGRFKGVCDKDGCDFNSYRMGNRTFFGKGPTFTIDTNKPITVVTQFLTSDGTDTGDLIEIRRQYLQDGKLVRNSEVINLDGFTGNSLSDEFCDAQKTAFDNRNDFKKKGGMMKMGEALKRGMVLVLSLWDDRLTNMLWLDSDTPVNSTRFPRSKPGVQRGPCKTTDGDPDTLRSSSPDAYVAFSNIMLGEIGSTYGKGAQEAREALAETAAAAGITPQPTAAAGTTPQPSDVVGTASQPKPAAGDTFTPAASVKVGPQKASLGTAKGACCTSSKDTDKCHCWKTAVVDSGFCGTEAECGGCGGTWCPDGVTISEFEEHEDEVARAFRSSRLTSATIIASVTLVTVLTSIILAVAWRSRSSFAWAAWLSGNELYGRLQSQPEAEVA